MPEILHLNEYLEQEDPELRAEVLDRAKGIVRRITTTEGMIGMNEYDFLSITGAQAIVAHHFINEAA